MQNYFNNDSWKVPSQRGKGIAGTAFIHVSVLLLLAFVGFKPPNTDSDRGILVNFGTDETGSGLIEPSPNSYYEEISIPNLPVPQKKEDALLTQNYDNESPLVKKVVPETEQRKKEKLEAARIRRAEFEAEKVKRAQEEAERKKIEQDQKRTTDIISKTKNAFSNGRNSGTTSTGEGITGGEGNQGDPNGSVDSKIRGKNTGTGTSGNGNGISYDLGGRNFRELPNPKYEYQGEGIVIVDINVDRSGNVTLAVPGGKGSTTLDDYLLATAKEAALKAKFDPKPDGPSVQKGTIKYTFKLR